MLLMLLKFLLKSSSWAIFYFLFPRLFFGQLLCKTEVYENPFWFYRHRVDDLIGHMNEFEMVIFIMISSELFVETI